MASTIGDRGKRPAAGPGGGRRAVAAGLLPPGGGRRAGAAGPGLPAPDAGGWVSSPALPKVARVQPILHLSIPVRDLEEARRFYVDTLGCRAGRARPDFVDVWFYGMQISLQDRPDEVAEAPPGGSRHFGVTLGRDDFEAVVARLRRGEVVWLVPVTTDHPGTPAGADQDQAGRPQRQRHRAQDLRRRGRGARDLLAPVPGATEHGH